MSYERIIYRISIHAPREGERLADTELTDEPEDFNPRSPRGGATLPLNIVKSLTFHFNPRSPRGGATQRSQPCERDCQISIHAPREGERLSLLIHYHFLCQFQSTLPARGSDLRLLTALSDSEIFQSTLPARGSDATVTLYPARRPAISIHAPREGERRARLRRGRAHPHFNPRSPRGGATTVQSSVTQSQPISIHAPREGERLSIIILSPHIKLFQSTLPARGSDVKAKMFCLITRYFNPRSPRGGATALVVKLHTFRYNFNPRSPRGGATRNIYATCRYSYISIHAPREGERPRLPCLNQYRFRISIHAPREGERPYGRVVRQRANLLFQSTLPARGSDRNICKNFLSSGDFNPRSPRGGATAFDTLTANCAFISIHAPREGERLSKI